MNYIRAEIHPQRRSGKIRPFGTEHYWGTFHQEADCGAECEVPFKPTQGRPVYCRDCFRKHKPEERDRSRF